MGILTCPTFFVAVIFAKMVMSGHGPVAPCGAPNKIKCRTLAVSHVTCGRLCVYPISLRESITMLAFMLSRKHCAVQLKVAMI